MTLRHTRLGFAALGCLALGACSGLDTMFRHDSLSHVTIHDREMTVSWVEMPPSAVDIMVGLVPKPGEEPLDRDTAIAAAARVATSHCSSARAAFPPVEYPGGRFAFRYVCGDAPLPPPPPGFEQQEPTG